MVVMQGHWIFSEADNNTVYHSSKCTNQYCRNEIPNKASDNEASAGWITVHLAQYCVMVILIRKEPAYHARGRCNCQIQHEQDVVTQIISDHSLPAPAVEEYSYILPSLEKGVAIESDIDEGPFVHVS